MVDPYFLCIISLYLKKSSAKFQTPGIILPPVTTYI
jgi:hypothetical protein